MVKDIINAFDHMDFCLVMNLIMGGNRAVTWPSIIATKYVSFTTTLNTCYPQKKLISNTGASLGFFGVSNRVNPSNTNALFGLLEDMNIYISSISPRNTLVSILARGISGYRY